MDEIKGDGCWTFFAPNEDRGAVFVIVLGMLAVTLVGMILVLPLYDFFQYLDEKIIGR